MRSLVALNHFSQSPPSITAGDWLLVAVSFLVGAFTVGAAIGIARWQQSADRQERIDLQRRRSQEDSERQSLLRQQESWRPEYEEIRNLLNTLGDQAHDFRSRGPFDIRSIRKAGLDRLQLRAEQLADRGPSALSDPLLRVASAVEKLRASAVPDDEGVIAKYRQAAASGAVHIAVPRPRVLYRKAISQYKAAEALLSVIAEARVALMAEWLGETARR